MHIMSRIPSPIGDLLAITAPGGTLHALEFADFAERLQRVFARRVPGTTLAPGAAPPTVAAAVHAYFTGDLRAIAALPIACIGTAFQQRVWAALRQIPAGETFSYSRLAAHIGQPSASRAVATANCANAMAIAVPCHRVICSNGALSGYNGGVDRKAWLLRHEGALL
ncbi:methylated-DNA--[protein]-cysteine S-methyltransferase [Sandarakinorhabdus sp.]|uniref:methylated-DNA--[protein]-cysteine S-methyltransferase n=1 Tax=Sandarakinorhabdus sp. TaxID=1916663 RepID=UPI003341555A